MPNHQYLTDEQVRSVRNYTRGFTLIELLVVIAIIGILVSIVAVGWISVSKRGRDSTRKSDLARLKQVLQQQYSDTRTYPIFEISGAIPIYAATWQLTQNGSAACSRSDRIIKIAPKYIAEIPTDPSDLFSDPAKYQNTSCDHLALNQVDRYLYISAPTGSSGPKPPTAFALMATLETSQADRLLDSQNPLKSASAVFGDWYKGYDNYNLNTIHVTANYLVDSKNQ